MPELYVLRVFCDERGDHGNPLGVVLDGAAVPRAERQQVAATLGFSETVFVDDRATAELQIFTPKVELPLAGHPLVGTSWLLRREAADGAEVTELRPPAGAVPTGGDAVSAWIEADPADAPPFVVRELGSAAEVEALEVPRGPDVHEDVWAWIDAERTTVRCRVFADGVGVPEDEATGSAALRLIAAVDRPVAIRQGVGSLIEGRPVAGGRARVGGRVVLDRQSDLDGVLRERR